MRSRLADAQEGIAHRAAACAEAAEELKAVRERARKAEKEASTARRAALQAHARVQKMERQVAEARASEEEWRVGHGKLATLASELQQQLSFVAKNPGTVRQEPLQEPRQQEVSQEAPALVQSATVS